MKRERLAAAALALSAGLLGGCATWAKRGVYVRPPRKLSVAVLPARFAVRIRNLNEVEKVSSKERLSSAQEKESVRLKVSELSRFVTDSFAARLRDSYFFAPIDSAAVADAISALSLSTAARLDAPELESLGKALKADAFLRVTVLGYGRIKRRWMLLLLSEGMLEGVVQGVVVAEATGSAPAAMAVGGEEALQEASEDIGGVFLLDKIFTPVILKAELVSAKNGRVVWRWWALGDRNRKALKKLPKAERSKKSVRLRLVFEAARDKLVKDLEKAALKNELPPARAR